MCKCGMENVELKIGSSSRGSGLLGLPFENVRAVPELSAADVGLTKHMEN